jgi:hypothetical protein
MGINVAGRVVRRAVAVLAAVAIGWPLVAGSSAPVGAQAPPLDVEPSTGLTDGQEVTVTVNGPETHVAQCHGRAAANPALENLRDLCGNSTFVQGTARPAQVTLTVRSTLTSSTGQTVDCGLQPGDCAIVALALGGNSGYPVTSFVSVPITIEPPVFAAVLPDEPLYDGAPVDVLVRGTPGGTITVAQCASPVAAVLADSRCGPPLDLLVDADGRVTSRFTVRFDVETGGEPLDCQVEACALAAFDEDGTRLRELPITMQAPLALTVEPAAGLIDGAVVGVQVTGYRKLESDLWQCRAGTTPDDLGRFCVPLGARIPAGWDRVWREVAVKASFTTAMGVAVTCGNAPGDCVILTGTASWFPWVSTPVSFARAALAPSVGLLDGQPITLSATGLVPSSAYRVVRCDGASVNNCEGSWTAPLLVTDAEGNGQMETTAAQRFTSATATEQYCRDECSIRLWPTAEGAPAVTVPYAMAAGSVTASPGTGLGDGDTVTLTGTDLMASYAGPSFWFFPSTGGWGVGQCGTGMLDEPTILGFFTHCAVVPPGAVDVRGSTATVDVPVAASFTSILGHQVDCTTAPDACVLALARIEQDGSVSIHAAPFSFGGST